MGNGRKQEKMKDSKEITSNVGANNQLVMSRCFRFAAKLCEGNTGVSCNIGKLLPVFQTHKL